mgnify:CR=1 FL=1
MSALIAFLQAMTLFGSPAILALPAGFHTMTTKIWSLFQFPPKPELGAAAAWVRAGKGDRVLIVTSPYHTRRARGLAAVVLPGDDHAAGESGETLGPGAG